MYFAIDENAFPPERAHEDDAGMDLKSPIETCVPARGSAVIDTGIHVEIPHGYAGFLKSKSGLNVKHDITSEGVIDAGYTGSIVCKLYNHGEDDYLVHRGDKITQLVVLPVMLGGYTIVEKIEGSERGDAGFGSTGK
jgi:deoxyuridine 5''-triphosphate nucleotidohydrolase (dut)